MLSSIWCCLWKPISTKYAVLDFIICITSEDKKIPVKTLSSNSYPCICHKSAGLLQQSHAWPPTVSNFKLLQRVQNAVARIALDLSKFCHITPALQQLHWLPVIKQIQFNSASYFQGYSRSLSSLHQWTYNCQSQIYLWSPFKQQYSAATYYKENAAYTWCSFLCSRCPCTLEQTACWY